MVQERRKVPDDQEAEGGAECVGAEHGALLDAEVEAGHERLEGDALPLGVDGLQRHQHLRGRQQALACSDSHAVLICKDLGRRGCCFRAMHQSYDHYNVCQAWIAGEGTYMPGTSTRIVAGLEKGHAGGRQGHEQAVQGGLEGRGRQLGDGRQPREGGGLWHPRQHRRQEAAVLLRGKRGRARLHQRLRRRRRLCRRARISAQITRASTSPNTRPFTNTPNRAFTETEPSPNELKIAELG